MEDATERVVDLCLELLRWIRLTVQNCHDKSIGRCGFKISRVIPLALDCMG